MLTVRPRRRCWEVVWSWTFTQPQLETDVMGALPDSGSSRAFAVFLRSEGFLHATPHGDAPMPAWPRGVAACADGRMLPAAAAAASWRQAAATLPRKYSWKR